MNLESLTARAQSHGATRNRFFGRWRESPLDGEPLACFLRNYQAWVQSFPAALAGLVALQTRLDARLEVAKTLFSECGYGRLGKDHASLFALFARELLARCGGDPSLLETERSPLLPTTKRLLAIERDIYRHGPLCEALGAQLALEWQAYDMVMQLYEGARLYKDRWPTELSFHEACEYFYAHLGEAEKEHREESLRALESAIQGPEDFEAARSGADRHLEAIEEFWNGIADELGRVER